MALTGKRVRRLKVDDSSEKEERIVTTIKNEHYYNELNLECKSGTCYFIRLRYKNCPYLKKRGKNTFPEGAVLIPMHRDEQLDLIYDALKGIESASMKGYFSKLAQFFSWCDDRDIKVNFLEPKFMVEEYMAYLEAKIKKGVLKEGTASSHKSAISVILREYGFHQLNQSLPSFNCEADRTPHNTLSDPEYVMLGKAIFNGYKKYRKHLIAGTKPSICVHFSSELLNEMGLSQKEINIERGRAKKRVSMNNAYVWINNMVKHAIMLTYMYTGLNPMPLFELSRKDVKKGFKKGVGDYYEIDSEKGRALYQKQTNEIGFTKYTKEFFESWLRASDLIYGLITHDKTDQDPIFPFITKSGNAEFYGRWRTDPQTHINKALALYSHPHITSSIYRKTRADKLFRATSGDVILVADANNSSTSTVVKDYLFGADETHQLGLGSAFQAQYDMIKGKDKSIALAEHEVRFVDPLKDFNPENEEVDDTPSGKCFRSHSDYKNKVNKDSRKYRNYNQEVTRCLNFWDCFGCPCHAIAIEVDEVHKLLSLRDSLMEKVSSNGVNCKPNESIMDTLDIVTHILNRIESEYSEIYKSAAELNRDEPHPLWDDEFAIDDMEIVYNG